MRFVACLAVFAVLCLSTVSASESVSPEQALDILDTLQSSPEVLTQRKLLQSGPLSHQLAVCRAEALEGKLCPIIAHYLKVCRKKFGIHTLKCSATSATACTSMVKYGISSSGRCVCNIGYEHLGPNCVACPPGKVKNTIAYAYCKLCALGKYQPKAGQATCLKCDIKTHRVNLGKPHPRSSCTLRKGATTPTPKSPTKPPSKSPTKPPTKTPSKSPTPAPTVAPTTSSPPPGPAVKAPPPVPLSMSPPPAPLFVGK